MRCAQFRKLASSYLDRQLDRQLTSRQQHGFSRHIAQCGGCQTYLTQLRHVAEGLSGLPRPAVPPELLSETLDAVDHLRQEPAASSGLWLINFAMSHSRPVAAVASFLITIICYGGILGQFKPIPYLPSFTHTEAIEVTSTQYDWVNGRVSVESSPVSYTFPRVQEASAVNNSLVKMGTTPIVFVALVHSDGHASLVEVLAPPSTPQLIEQVQYALQSLKFQPATTGGRAVPTQLVLMVERVDIRG
jgi:hypothetical protein